MRTLIRAGLAGAALLASTATPATALGVIVATCDVTYRLGAYTTGTGTCQITGTTTNGQVHVLAPAGMAFSVMPGSLPRCAQDTATGTMAGALNVAFTWTRFGEAGVVTTTGDLNGAGAGAFVEKAAAQQDNLTCGAITTQSVVLVLTGA